jgi:hypothetical protein
VPQILGNRDDLILRPEQPINHTCHPPFPSLSPPFDRHMAGTRSTTTC